jgi:hypothetical protein
MRYTPYGLTFRQGPGQTVGEAAVDYREPGTKLCFPCQYSLPVHVNTIGFLATYCLGLFWKTTYARYRWCYCYVTYLCR